MFELSENNKKIYNILSVKEIPEEAVVSVELEHIVTKAKLILFICDDENRVFNIAFKTPVENGKGTPHILEHSVLCGSRKYNIKDPFIELAKGSMNTFLNAMTFPDKTCYPVASANLKDFHNLMDVYLDAVFYPNAIKNEKIFMQEGWHYEIENKSDDLKVNGVVYNEMKGVYSDPDSVLETAILENLFTGTNYAYESGGNPSEIINLKYDEFVEFHKKYYSASNSIIYLYGKLDYNAELENLENNYLKHFDFVEAKAVFKSVQNINHDREKTDYYNIDTLENNDKSYIAYSFALPTKMSSLNNIVMRIINYVLFASDSGILKEKLLNEGFGESVLSNYEVGIKQGFYSIISKNINVDKKDNFIRVILSSIKEMVENGLDVNKFKAAINSTYFNYAEGEFSTMPRGLVFSLLSLDSYLYGQDVSTYIEYKEAFDYIKSVDLNDKNNIFSKTLKEVFLENNNTAINILNPKVGYSAEKDKILASELNNRKEKLSTEELQNIIDNMKELKAYQVEEDSEENKKSIPMLKLSDIDRDKQLIDFEVDKIDNIDTMMSFKNDKDIVYIDLNFDVTDFSNHEIYMMSLIDLLVLKTDLKTISFHDFNNYIDINTGGLAISICNLNSKCLLSMSIKVIEDKVDTAFEILYRTITDTIFDDKKRINILLNESKNKSLLSVLSCGHIAAANRAKSLTDYPSGITDRACVVGIGHYKFINSLCNIYDSNCDLVNETLNLLYKRIINNKMYLNVCTNEKYYDKIKIAFKSFNEKLSKYNKGNEYSSYDDSLLDSNIEKIDELIEFDSFDKKVRREAIVTPNDINFCAISNVFDKEKFSGQLYVLKTLFNYEYLWTNIRVLGGAYGCLSSFTKNGIYTFVSYRDPNVSNTNKVYFGVKEFLNGIKKTSDEVSKYVIGSIGGFDNPQSVVDHFRGNQSAYFNNMTDADYNGYRHDMLDMKPEDFNSLSEIFSNIEDASECALISANKIEEAKKEYDLVCQLME